MLCLLLFAVPPFIKFWGVWSQWVVKMWEYDVISDISCVILMDHFILWYYGVSNTIIDVGEQIFIPKLITYYARQNNRSQ